MTQLHILDLHDDALTVILQHLIIGSEFPLSTCNSFLAVSQTCQRLHRLSTSLSSQIRCNQFDFLLPFTSEESSPPSRHDPRSSSSGKLSKPGVRDDFVCEHASSPEGQSASLPIPSPSTNAPSCSDCASPGSFARKSHPLYLLCHTRLAAVHLPASTCTHSLHSALLSLTRTRLPFLSRLSIAATLEAESASLFRTILLNAPNLRRVALYDVQAEAISELPGFRSVLLAVPSVTELDHFSTPPSHEDHLAAFVKRCEDMGGTVDVFEKPTPFVDDEAHPAAPSAPLPVHGQN